MRYDVTLEATGAWEVWRVEIPDEIPEEEAEMYINENFSSLDPELRESGNDYVEITDVEKAS